MLRKIFVRRRTLRSPDQGTAEEIQRALFAGFSRSFVDDRDGTIKALGDPGLVVNEGFQSERRSMIAKRCAWIGKSVVPWELPS